MPSPYIIAGPCSVESRRQLAAVVEALMTEPKVAVIRCGVWKPRTRPGGFEGLGETALQWMGQVAQQYPEDRRPRFACEVARPEHVEQAMHHGLRTFWVGARTTANPFMVQELAESLRGTGATVLVKNAPSPDVRLWMGAVERLRQAGIADLMAVHRGFDIFSNGDYRNTPLWEVPMEFRRTMPDVPILCDPSHIGGRRDLIAPLSQTAMDLGFDGLMIEVHNQPDAALTDAAQQITPEALHQLLAGLTPRRTDTVLADSELRLLREQIDLVDQQILRLLSQRMGVSRQIARVKAQDNMAVFQPKRWEQLLGQRMEIARSLDLDPLFVKELYEKIHAESVKQQLLN